MFHDFTAPRPEQMMALYQKYDYTLLSAGDVLSNMKNEMYPKGPFFIRNDGKISRDFKGIDHNTPWIFMQRSPERNCLLWHRIMYGVFGMLPIWCRLNCWKVVVRPQTLEELFLLKELMESLRLPSKLGSDPRLTVFGHYSGFFYTNSIEEGLDRLDQVRKEVGNFISKKIPVYLKLGCTEFEHSFGPTNQYRQPTKEDHKNEDTILGCFDSDLENLKQPKHLRDHICQNWIHYAHDRGDPTVHLFNKGKPLFPKCVTYERETPKEEPKKAAKKAAPKKRRVANRQKVKG